MNTGLVGFILATAVVTLCILALCFYARWRRESDRRQDLQDRLAHSKARERSQHAAAAAADEEDPEAGSARPPPPPPAAPLSSVASSSLGGDAASVDTVAIEMSDARKGGGNNNNGGGGNDSDSAGLSSSFGGDDEDDDVDEGEGEGEVAEGRQEDGVGNTHSTRVGSPSGNNPLAEDAAALSSGRRQAGTTPVRRTPSPAAAAAAPIPRIEVTPPGRSHSDRASYLKMRFDALRRTPDFLNLILDEDLQVLQRIREEIIRQRIPAAEHEEAVTFYLTQLFEMSDFHFIVLRAAMERNLLVDYTETLVDSPSISHGRLDRCYHRLQPQANAVSNVQR